jgi:hypothetical protein
MKKQLMRFETSLKLGVVGFLAYVFTSPIVTYGWAEFSAVVMTLTGSRTLEIFAYLLMPFAFTAYPVYKSILIEENWRQGIVPGLVIFLLYSVSYRVAVAIGRIDPLVDEGTHILFIIPGILLGFGAYLLRKKAIQLTEE